MTLVEYKALFEKQNGCCWICRRHRLELSQDLHVDHNHNTGKTRALLCMQCNAGIGHFRDSIGLLLQAAQYLKENDG